MTIRTGDPEFAREVNRAHVLDALRANHSQSRSDLARELHLSKVTASSVVDELLTEHLIVEDGIRDPSGKGGRKSILLSLDPFSNCVVGVDIGVTQVRGAVSNLRGDLIARSARETTKGLALNSVVTQVRTIVEELLRAKDVCNAHPLGLGITLGGIIERQNGLIKFSPDFGWSEVKITDLIHEATPLGVVVDNNTRATALGERWFGAARGARNAFFVNVSWGLGSALILNNQIYDNHSEFGHMYVTREKVHCDCGKFGCLEAVCSGRAIAQAARQARLKWKGKWPTARDVAELADRGDERARSIYANAGTHLGRGLSHVANLLNPEKIIVGGGVSRAGNLLLDPLRAEFEKHTMDVILSKVSVETSHLEDAALRGAVTLALNRFVFKPEVINR